MGSAAFAIPSLNALLAARHEIAAIVTQPDRPCGRGGGLGFTPVKEWALANRTPLLQPEKVNAPGRGGANRRPGGRRFGCGGVWANPKKKSC